MVDSPASTPRVPAWKKLGLKLKYAKDEAPTPAGTPENASASRKRSRPSEEESTPSQLKEEGTSSKSKSEDKKSKKRKTSQDDKDVTSTSTAAIDESATTPAKPPKKEKKQKKAEKSEEKEQKSEAQPQTKPAVPDQAVSTPIRTLKRKKSVSFTPDTKTIDGDQTLVKAWSSSLRQEEILPSEPPTQSTEQAALTNGDDANKPSKAELKKAKKEEKRKAKNDAATTSATSAPTSADTPPYLTYLQQYHTDRANWKFNKVRQSTLFDNLFKIQRLPTSYDDALRAYLKGLKGDAVRQRLQEQAREILEKTKDEEGQKDDADGSSDSSSSDSESDSSSSDSSSESDSDSDSDSDSGSPTPSTTAGDNDKKNMELSHTKTAALNRQLSRSAARRREQRDGANSADQQLRLAQRRRAEMILEVLGSRPQGPDTRAPLRPTTVREAQVAKAQADWESKKKAEKKKKVESESEESSVVSSSSSEESSSEESSSDESSDEDSSSSDESSSDDSD
ncbi:hypothetical protein IWZ00DRAFT_516002 [Phyllosticta capitalensis]|uniref:WKF domain-containing protein n=1 Tax=Phyllosticta capitalensis TaxID=121624 RepID=A0ABR1YMG9_9PEZI